MEYGDRFLGCLAKDCPVFGKDIQRNASGEQRHIARLPCKVYPNVFRKYPTSRS